jgi:hypothetical protein
MRHVLTRRLLLKAEETGERSLVLVMGGFYLLFAMMVLVVDEETLETGNMAPPLSVGNPDPDPHVFESSGSIRRRYGSGSRYFPFLIKGAELTEIMLAKLNFNTKFEQKNKLLRLKIMCLPVSYEKKI